MSGGGLLTFKYGALPENIYGLNRDKSALTGWMIGDEDSFRYLKQELGILLEEKKNQSLADAISNPGKFIADRTLATNKATETASIAFQTYMGKLLNIGVPLETARNTATLHAKAIFDAEMNIYEMGHPGYATAIGSTMVDRGAAEGIKDLYLQDKAQKKAYKKKIIKKYKAKKAAKAANTPAQ